MSCHRIDIPGGTAFVCNRGSSQRKSTCAYCKARPTAFLCDREYTGAKAGKTCDGKLCNECAWAIPGEADRHLCPPHKRERDKLDAEATKKAGDWFASVVNEAEVALFETCICDGIHYGDPKCPRHRVDRDVLAKLFPDWDPNGNTTWWGDRDAEPPVGFLSGEIRQRQSDRLVELSDRQIMNARLDTHDFDGDCCARCGIQVMPDGTLEASCAEVLEAQVNMYGCRPCPVCRADKRFPHKSGFIICDDCGHEARGTRYTTDDVDGLALDVYIDAQPHAFAEGAAKLAREHRATPRESHALVKAASELDRIHGPTSASRPAAEAALREKAASLAHAEARGRWGDGDSSLPPPSPPPRPCSRRHNRCAGCGGCAVVARDFPVATDCRPCDWNTCPTQVPRLRDVEAKKQATISEKVAHVRHATQDREHACHWPGCKRQVKPAFWGCSEHWYRLPQELRDKIWRAYRPGQEVTMTPSREYVAVAREVEAWIAELQASTSEPRRTSFEEAARRVRERDAARQLALGGDTDKER